MSLDPDQRAAAEAPGSVVVTAGAGTGKTHMLARRYLHHLRQGLRPLEVVAVTFTRRAAEELRARIREVVRQALEAGDPALDDDVLAEVEAAPIGTVHALAQVVCRRYPDAAGVAPDFSVVDELDGALWVAEALDEALAALPDDAFGVLPFDLLRATLAAALDDPTRVRAALALEPDAVLDAIAAVRRAAFEASVASPMWRQEIAFLSGFEGPPGHPTEAARAAAVGADARLRALGPDGDGAAIAEAWTAMTTIRYHLGAKAGWMGPDLASVKASLKRLRAWAETAWAKGTGGVALAWGPIEETGARRIEHVRGVLDAALDTVDRRKRRAKSLSFADLETHAARALAHPWVQADVHTRWRALLLDEAQDVNPTQAALIDALRAPDAPLTAVGDAKQSIYGFRGAEPTVLAGLRTRVAAMTDGRVVELRTSYRTHRSLVELVNRVFERALGDEAGPLAAVREPPPWPAPALRHRSLPEGVGVGDADARAAAEADAIADAIQALLEARPLAEVNDADAPGGVRPLAVDDVAVLATGRRTLATLEARLPARGVPVLNAGGGDVLTTPEGLDVRALLRAVVDPTDGAAVAALLRSPFVAADDRAIARFAAAMRSHRDERRTGDREPRTPPHPWWRRLHDADDDGLRRAAALLADLRAAREGRAARASDLVRRADDLTGFRAVLAHLPQGGRRVADFDGMIGLLQRLESGHADALGVVRRLERYAAAGVAVARPPLRARGAVSLLTIHAAKGLEWPVVIVADLAGRGRRDTPDVILDPHVGLALRSYDPAGESAVYRYAQAALRDREVAERRRLAYVAFTRARDLLVLSDRGGRRDGMAAALGDALEIAGVVATAVPAPTGGTEAAPRPPAPPPPDPNDPAWPRPERRG
jgi:ATP-dependent helicase/nuclease subunit A